MLDQPTDLGIVAVCDYEDEPGHPEVIEAEAVLIGADGMAYVCASERCAAEALDDLEPPVKFHSICSLPGPPTITNTNHQAGGNNYE